uniref:Uncharacterized protein AlNc14C44G3610 n=1 Tax=Albugo laibachii Nc14 TaxID=890382 RepID=F0WA80_9STRA|nr:conserved hypothetical protein [Albugo laibachii Nc14]|eukprot:CCA18050.1 conserved hypothetical protein [Albugo laibachii Nc14]
MFPWEEVFDPESKRIYYFNHETGESSWTLPYNALYNERERTHGNDIESAWRIAYDNESHSNFYYNVITGQSSWTLPNSVTEDFTASEHLSSASSLIQSRWRGYIARKKLSIRHKLESRHSGTDTADLDVDKLSTGARKSDNQLEDVDQTELSDSHPNIGMRERCSDGISDLDVSGLLARRISPHLWILTSLKNLNLSHNHLEHISARIQDLEFLQVLDLSFNRLSKLPSGLHSTSLHTINASHNHISTISSMLWTLTDLSSLDLSHNDLRLFPIPVHPAMAENAANFYGAFNLEFLELSSNKLIEFPRFQSSFHRLRMLNLSNNEIPGLQEEDLLGLCALEELDLARNKLKTLPQHEETYKLLGNTLKTLQLDHNELSALPSGMVFLKSLQELNVGMNRLDTLPILQHKWKSLISLHLDTNLKLRGFDNWTPFIPKLKYLSLSRCSLQGTINISRFSSSLVELNLSNNRLDSISFGHETLEIEEMDEPQLRHAIEIPHGRRINCPIAATLRVLNLASNTISRIPFEIAQLGSLTHLLLDDNDLKELPDTIISLGNLEVLHCDNNSIQKLPLSIGNLSNLRVLSISCNCVSQLPSSIMDLRSLQAFRANGNCFVQYPAVLYQLDERIIGHIELCNNSIQAESTTRSHSLHRQAQVRNAKALVDSGQLEKAENQLSALLEEEHSAMSLGKFTQHERPQNLVQQYYLRALCRSRALEVSACKSHTLHENICRQQKKLRRLQLLNVRHIAATPKLLKPVDCSLVTREPQDGEIVMLQSQLDKDVRAFVNQREYVLQLSSGALRDLQIVIELAQLYGFDELVTVYMLQGDVELHRKEFSRAIQSYGKAIELFRNTTSSRFAEAEIAIWLKRAQAHICIGQVDAALDQCREVLAHFPAHPQTEKLAIWCSQEMSAQRLCYPSHCSSAFTSRSMRSTEREIACKADTKRGEKQLQKRRNTYATKDVDLQRYHTFLRSTRAFSNEVVERMRMESEETKQRLMEQRSIR